MLTEHPLHSTERVAGAPSPYNDGDADSLRRDSWDGRGPEPEHLQRSAHAKNGNRRHRFSPFADIVDDSEVEGEPQSGLYRSRSNLAPPSRTSSTGTGAAFDPLTDEHFYEQRQEVPPEGLRKPQKKKFGSGLLKNRSRYEQPFDTAGLQASRTRSRTGDGDDEYQDEFEREINGGGGASAAAAPPVGGAGSAGRFDSFEPEGPEDAWASARPVGAQATGAHGAGSAREQQQQPLQPQKTGRAEENDGDRAPPSSPFFVNPALTDARDCAAVFKHSF